MHPLRIAALSVRQPSTVHCLLATVGQCLLSRGFGKHRLSAEPWRFFIVEAVPRHRYDCRRSGDRRLDLGFRAEMSRVVFWAKRFGERPAVF